MAFWAMNTVRIQRRRLPSCLVPHRNCPYSGGKTTVAVEDSNPKSSRLMVPVELPDYGLLIDSRRHGSGYRTSRHAHDHLSLIYVISGEGRFVTNRFHCLMSSDSVTLIGENEEHQMIDEPDRSMAVYVLRISAALAASHGELLAPLRRQESPLVVPRYRGHQLRSLLRQMLYEQNHRPQKYELAILQYLASFLLQLYRIKVEHDSINDQSCESSSLSRVNAVLQFVARNYAETYSLSEVARLAGLSQRHFASLCRKKTGRSYVEYVNTVRTEKAKDLLESSVLSITAIAFEVGYEEFSTFYRAFKKRYHLSPRAFRDRIARKKTQAAARRAATPPSEHVDIR